MGRMQASDKSMPSCTHAENLKEIRSYDRVSNKVLNKVSKVPIKSPIS